MILEIKEIEDIITQLKLPNEQFQQNYPGEKVGRKPVHTVYGGAQLFIKERTKRIGDSALRAFNTYVNNFVDLAKILALEGYEHLPSEDAEIKILENQMQSNPDRQNPAWLSYMVYNRVINKLETEAVEDFRIDFEDGFGKRSDQEEDHYAEFTAKEVASAMQEELLPPFIGIRIKPLTEKLKHRSIRTLNIFLSTLLEHSSNKLPDNFVITLPKVTIPEEVEILDKVLTEMEIKLGFPAHTFKMEIMVETPQSIINSKGEANLSLLIKPSKERIVGAHFGVYDYTASVNIIAKHQEMDHDVCNFARHMMKVCLTGTGIRLSDGATNILPVGPHRPKEDQTLTSEELKKNREVVVNAWRQGFSHIKHSLLNGYYQGWDLHPAQLPIRYAAVYSFFLTNLQTAINRLKSFVSRAAQATLTGDVFDDAATASALLNYFVLGLEAQAITTEEAMETGLTIKEIQSQSFDIIIESKSSQN